MSDQETKIDESSVKWVNIIDSQENKQQTPEEKRNELNNKSQILNQRMYKDGQHYDAPKTEK